MVDQQRYIPKSVLSPFLFQDDRFHVLGAIFNLFYASLLQPVQAALGWKRIKGSDVPACYQQAAGLALMVFEEVKRQLYTAFTIYLDSNKTLNAEWQQQESFKDRAHLSHGVMIGWHVLGSAGTDYCRTGVGDHGRTYSVMDC
jgi:hypothetical protein